MTAFDSEIPEQSPVPVSGGVQGVPADEILIGRLEGIDEQGQPLVSFGIGESVGPLQAIATVSVTPQHIGRQVGLLFAKNNTNSPVLIGYIHSPLHSLLDNIEIADTPDVDEAVFDGAEVVADGISKNQNNDVLIDGNRVVLEGKDEVVLKCGDASISLNKNGKIAIRGKYLLNRSSGVNRIMGGSVQVN